MKNNDLVLIRIIDKIYYNTWFRIMFIDNDNTFIGKCERIDNDFNLYEIGDCIKFDKNQIQRIYNNEEFCYSDNVTICKCKGLCRNK